MNDAMIVNDEKIMIEQNISSYEIVTVELRLSTIQKNFYNFIHDRLIDILNKNINKKFRKKTNEHDNTSNFVSCRDERMSVHHKKTFDLSRRFQCWHVQHLTWTIVEKPHLFLLSSHHSKFDRFFSHWLHDQCVLHCFHII